jgi:HCOMODA/2-hydroxy-3-carboxy-muconic semialdehyde decarboxylase
MRGHGAVVATHDLKATAFVSIYLMVNAALIGEARQLGEITYLSEGEIRLTEQMNFRARSQNRAWEYWARRAGFNTTIND